MQSRGKRAPTAVERAHIGAVCELFSGRLVDGYQERLQQNRLETLQQRTPLTVEAYEALFFEEVQLDDKGKAINLPFDETDFALIDIQDHKRIYRKK